MSLYATGRRVYVRSHDRVGTVSEANYLRYSRRASYLIDFGDGTDYLTGSKDLRVADWFCDACDRPRPASDPGAVERDTNGDVLVRVCWFCVNVAAKES